MREREFSQGKMAQETGLSYNTVKKYLRRMDAEAGDGSHAETVVDPGGERPPTVAEAKIVPQGRAPGRRA